MTTTSSAIIADDLTGACDAAAPFAAIGLPTWVTWHAEHANEPAARLVSLSSNSRADEPSQAVQKVQRAAAQLAVLGPALVFKKIDSTLKGNWAAETSAVLDALSMNAAVIVPAFPAMGRQIVNGQLMVHGSAASESILSIIHNQCRAAAIQISLSELRGGARHLANLIAVNPRAARFVVVDSKLDSDLDIVAEALALVGQPILPVGSGGLAASIARRARRDTDAVAVRAFRRDASPPIAETIAMQRSVVVFAGSTNPQTEIQLNALAKAKTVVDFSPEGESNDSLQAVVTGGKHIAVHVQWSAPAMQLVERVIDVCHRSTVGGLVLTGGDTAQLICDRCFARGIWIKGEIEHGVPWGRLSGGTLDGVTVVTKAGGFGDSACLVRVTDFLQDNSRHRPRVRSSTK